tara:strand:+ start:9909 stop:10754 length:846 start_codon:yes stop_codon:yes gene_type:complete
MKLIFFSFFFNFIKTKYTITSQLSRESFVGSWFIREGSKQKIIHLQPYGSIYKSGESKNNYIGQWETNKEHFTFNLKYNNSEKKYYGKIFNNTLNISGTVCEGLFSPYYINNFTMTPVFEQFHNVSVVNNSDEYIYLNQNNVTGKWLLENIYTNKLYLLELHTNNTWNSLYFDYTNGLRGKWNLFNETNEININSAIKVNGRNIWLVINKESKQSYINCDMVFIGRITQLGNIYYNNEDTPLSNNEEKIIISSKINGSIMYGFDLEPEVSEKFYMKRWFNY